MKKLRQAVPLLGGLVIAGIGIGAALIWHQLSGNAGAEDTAAYEHGSFRIIIQSETDAAEPLKELPLRITVADAAGNPAQAQEISVSLSMPGMLCGSFPAAIMQEGPGLYTAVGIPVMRGSWEADIRLQSGNEPVRILYPFRVR